MAEPVVDVLEVVEVHEQDREAVRRACAPNERVREAIHEEDPVRQAGERVVQRLVAELVLEVLAIADVDEDALHHQRPAVDVAADDRLVVDDPHHAAVARDQSVFPAPLRLSAALEVLVLGLDHPVAIGRDACG